VVDCICTQRVSAREGERTEGALTAVRLDFIIRAPACTKTG